MDGVVLVVTASDDPAADLVVDVLNERRVPLVRLDPDDFPHSLDLAAELGPRGLGGTVTPAHTELPADNVRSVYWRRPSAYTAPPGMDDQDARWVIDQSRWGLGGVLACLPGALYLNHPWRNRDAESKPAQLAGASACGLAIPPTLITNQPDRARAFARHHAPIVYKPLWPSRYHAPDGTGRAIWVRPVDPSELDASVAGAAHLFQACVDKDADIRLTAVGDRAFAVRIDGAPVLDWREDYSRLTYTPVATPKPVVEAVRAYLARFNLSFGVFDFALDRTGQWIFLECNPNGQWSWFPDHITAPITHALADLLQKGRR
ncbi:ATP-grasp ribosomal peptide maturase [Streptomonospora sp. PA3]|uniref:ATP-grasp ribosomal peptide maturase n=1 Tax=Streptomonospora sp. PA3 TaxID=2607326 RepID=UPI0031BBA558